MADPLPMNTGSDVDANYVMDKLLVGEDFSIPEVANFNDKFDALRDDQSPLFAEVEPLTVDDITTRVIGGDGVFDALMDAGKAHLRAEFEANRISGAEYTKAYIALVEVAMSNATQFVLGKEQAFWDAQRGQLAAAAALNELEIQRLKLAETTFEAHTAKANYATAKMGLALSDVQFAQEKFKLDSMLPKQEELLEAQVEGQGKENQILDGTIALQPGLVTLQTKDIALKTSQVTLTDAQGNKVTAEKALVDAQTDLAEGQVDMLPVQKLLLTEQMEAKRAETADTRTDGATVSGSVGKQKDLYSQQITSYQRDAENKAAKIFSDAWVTMKTIDEGLLPPTAFQNTNLDAILTKIKDNNSL